MIIATILGDMCGQFLLFMVIVGILVRQLSKSETAGTLAKTAGKSAMQHMLEAIFKRK